MGSEVSRRTAGGETLVDRCTPDSRTDDELLACAVRLVVAGGRWEASSLLIMAFSFRKLSALMADEDMVLVRFGCR